MLGRARSKLRQIRYYSASRERTRWHRASDAMLWLALLAAPLATVVMNYAVQRRPEPVVLHGQLAEREEDGGREPVPVAWLLDSDLASRPMGRITGSFIVTHGERRQGWPFTTRIEPLPPRLTLDIFSEPRSRENVQLAGDDPLRAAIGAALERDGPQRVATAWREGREPAAHVPKGWLANLVISYVALWAAGTTGVWVLWYLWRLAAGRRAQRAAMAEAEGRCRRCGYDMRGLEFNERCPECGALA